MASSSYYRWYARYQADGAKGLEPLPSQRRQFWNRIPEPVQGQIVKLALEQPEQSPRQIAWQFTDPEGYFVSESSVFRILKSFDLIESPAFEVVTAAEKFAQPTRRVHELWQTDFTYFKIQGWGWYYLSTVLDDYSRYILAWKLTPTMAAQDVQATLTAALAAAGFATRVRAAGASAAPVVRPRAGVSLRRTAELPERAGDGAHARGTLPPDDPGQDRALPSLDEEHRGVGELF